MKVELPCDIGEKIYIVNYKYNLVIEATVLRYERGLAGYNQISCISEYNLPTSVIIKTYGEWWFTDHEQAENKLKETKRKKARQ